MRCSGNREESESRDIEKRKEKLIMNRKAHPTPARGEVLF